MEGGREVEEGGGRDKSGGGIKERDARDEGEIQRRAHWLPGAFPSINIILLRVYTE